MNDIIALVGNPNSGKTTLFNALTGTYQKVGNWTGVTTEKKQGEYKKDKRIKIIDLPGLYSFSANGIDEKTAYNYLKNSPPKVIINVVDATNLERNLFLTTEILSLNIPTVIALNMFDELLSNGIKVNTNELSKKLGVPVIPVSALKKINLEELMTAAINNAEKPNLPPKSLNILSNKTYRYEYIENIVQKVLERKKTKAEKFTERADNILMHKVLGIPIFFAVMTLVYFLSMKVGGFIGGGIENLFGGISEKTSIALYNAGVSQWIISLLCDAVINSIGGVTSFLPQILILFMLMALIEQSGYAARVAFNFDRIFKSFGLSGKSLLPMIVSCGCTVSGLMASRTIERTNERRMTIFLSPFMPCGAKTAVFAWFATEFFGGNALIAASMYFLGIICACVFGLLLKKLKIFKGDNGTFLLEIPVLRRPSAKSVMMVMWEKVKEFTTKAGLIVFTVTVFLWLFKNVGISGYVGNEVEKSFLYAVGNALKYLFYPLGFCNWQTSVAIISGSFAKEAVVESLNLLSTDVQTLFTNEFSVYAFMSFILLSPPCVASIAAAKTELKSVKWLIFMILFQTTAAYIVAFLINLFGIIIDCSIGLLLSLIIVIIITLALILSIKILKKHGCKGCLKCLKESKKCNKKARRYTI